MKKERYEATELEIIRFTVEDVLTTSDDLGFGAEDGNIKLI